jgi:hypothetical protein
LQVRTAAMAVTMKNQMVVIVEGVQEVEVVVVEVAV